MNLYSRKQRFKILLLFLAVLIVGASLWYSSFIVNKIREEERERVELWSEAVKKRLSLINYTEKLFADLREEERGKVNLLAQATARMVIADDNNELLFLQDIIVNNKTIPVLIVDEKDQRQFDRNIDSSKIVTKVQVDSLIAKMGSQYRPIRISFAGIRQKVYYEDSRIITELEHTLDDLINSFISETVMNSGSVPVIFTDSSRTQVLLATNVDTLILTDSLALRAKLEAFASTNEPIEVRFGNQVTNYIYYSESIILTTLRYYPYVQLLIIGLFLFIAYLIFSTFRRAEQNQVWIGMAKETAHQLGTPLSSLMAWVQLLEAKGTDPKTIEKLNKDVERLETITDRFSKIGSNPELKPTDVTGLLNRAIAYLKPRLSSKVSFHINTHGKTEVKAMVNEALFGWVIENLFKNAVDAMEGQGDITIDVYHEIQNVYIDISDTGKGIPSAKHKAVFQPGFTTKRRGWGLGLSLAKRIIDNYHNGRIFVKRSEPDKGTTFRIVLKTKA